MPGLYANDGSQNVTIGAGSQVSAIPGNFSLAYVSSQVTVGTSAVVAIAAGTAPNHRTLKNTDSTNTIFIGPTNSVSSTNGFPLKPGESITFDAKASSAVLYAISAAGSPILAVIGF